MIELMVMMAGMFLVGVYFSVQQSRPAYLTRDGMLYDDVELPLVTKLRVVALATIAVVTMITLVIATASMVQ